MGNERVGQSLNFRAPNPSGISKGWAFDPTRLAPRAAFAYSLKKVIAVTAVIPPRLQAAPFEISAQSRTDTNHFARASPQVPCRRGRPGGRVSLVFLRDNPSGVYCSARKEEWLAICSFCMAGLLVEMSYFTTLNRPRPSQPSAGDVLN